MLLQEQLFPAFREAHWQIRETQRMLPASICLIRKNSLCLSTRCHLTQRLSDVHSLSGLFVTQPQMGMPRATTGAGWIRYKSREEVQSQNTSACCSSSHSLPAASGSFATSPPHREPRCRPAVATVVVRGGRREPLGGSPSCHTATISNGQHAPLSFKTLEKANMKSAHITNSPQSS